MLATPSPLSACCSTLYASQDGQARFLSPLCGSCSRLVEGQTPAHRELPDVFAFPNTMGPHDVGSKAPNCVEERDRLAASKRSTDKYRCGDSMPLRLGEQTPPSLPCAPNLSSPSPSSTSLVLVSLLRNTRKLQVNRLPHSPMTDRRVRGLWNPLCHCQFSCLHDDLLIHILSFVNMHDVLVAGRVCRRWDYCSRHHGAWEVIDATEFVHRTFDRIQKCPIAGATKATSNSLRGLLDSRQVTNLTIRSVEHRLTADVFLPSLCNLINLTLTGFADLTDTHVQVMMLSSMSSRAKNQMLPLQNLSLDQCPLLTDTTLQSIARYCLNLSELSVRGNSKMTSLAAMRDLWHVATEDQVGSASSLSLQSLFAPPPGPSRACFRATATLTLGNLRRLDMSRTGITASDLVTCLSSCSGPVRLEHLLMNGSGCSWDDMLFLKFCRAVSLQSLEIFEIACADRVHGSRCLTDSGLAALANHGNLLPRFQHLNLAGHKSITVPGITRVRNLAPNLKIALP